MGYVHATIALSNSRRPELDPLPLSDRTDSGRPDALHPGSPGGGLAGAAGIPALGECGRCDSLWK